MSQVQNRFESFAQRMTEFSKAAATDSSANLVEDTKPSVETVESVEHKDNVVVFPETREEPESVPTSAAENIEPSVEESKAVIEESKVVIEESKAVTVESSIEPEASPQVQPSTEPTSSFVQTEEKADSQDYLNDVWVESSQNLNAAMDTKAKALLSAVGIAPERAQNVKLVEVRKSNIKPLEISEVKDSSGRISEIIKRYQDDLGIAIVPVKITKIANWVKPKEHGIFTLNGESYFYPLNLNNPERIRNFTQSITKDLTEGKVIKQSMYESFEFEGQTHRTLRFTQSEMSDVVTYFSNFGARLLLVGNEDLLLVAGDYIYG